MKDLMEEIKKATEYRKEWSEKVLIDFMINYQINRRYNKLNFNHYYFAYDYWAGKETASIMKDDECVGLLHARFPIGFIHESVYEDFKNLNFYHLVKVNDFEKQEWSVDLQEMKNIAPEITWYDTDENAVSSKKFSVSDFEYAAN